jgi:hypothetical protein
MLKLLFLLLLVGSKPVPLKPVQERALVAFKKQAERPLRNYLPNYFFTEERLTDAQCWSRTFKPKGKNEKWTFKLIVGVTGFTYSGQYQPPASGKSKPTPWVVEPTVTYPDANHPIIADFDKDGMRDAVFWLRPVINKATGDLVVFMAGTPDSSFKFKGIQCLGSLLHSSLELGGFNARWINDRLIIEGPTFKVTNNNAPGNFFNLVYAAQYFKMDKGIFKHEKTKLVERGLKKYYWFEDQEAFSLEAPEALALEKSQKKRISEFMARIGYKYK